MCIHVSRSTTTPRPWDPSTRVITIPDRLGPERSLEAVQAVLTELGVEQPPDEALCYCGDPVAVAVARVPTQRQGGGVRLAS